MWNGSLKKLNFRKPSEDIREKIRTEMVWNIKRGSQTDKQKDFVMWSQEVRILDMEIWLCRTDPYCFCFNKSAVRVRNIPPFLDSKGHEADQEIG